MLSPAIIGPKVRSELDDETVARASGGDGLAPKLTLQRDLDCGEPNRCCAV